MFAFRDYAVVMAAIGAAAFVHGYGGIGFGIVAMALLSFLELGMERPSVVANINAMVAMALLFFLARTRSRVDWREAVLLLLGTAVGMPIGYWFICRFGDQPVFRVLLGGFLLFFALDGTRGIHAPRTLPAGAGVGMGAMSGFTGGAFVAAGPPVVFYLYSRVRDPRQMKATAQAVFMIGTAARLFMVGAGDAGYTREIVALGLAAAPVCAVGLAVGHGLSHRGSPLLFKRCVYTFIALFGAVILARGLWFWPA
ncbi:MAG: sulfite exporter TauE/SafE family protein [bacterium]|nr:sulfite exporter TauE/SafE family protein [bacterium]